MIRRLPVLLLVLILALPARAEDLQAVLDACLPQVEAAMGVRFRLRPAIREATREELVDVLQRELLPQLRVQLPGEPEERVQVAARAVAEAYGAMLLGKYDPARHAILVLPENLELVRPLLADPALDFLGAVVTHELVHAMDEHELGLVSRAAILGSRTEIEVWNALLEGHAQYITRKVLAARGDEDLFRAFEEHIQRLPPGLGEGEKYVMGLVLHSLRFAYVDGRRFFEALPEERHREVFAAPPASKAVILHPERYGQPEAAVPSLDLEPLWREVEQSFPGWTARRTVGDESLLRAAFADLVEPALAEPVLAPVRSVRMLVVRPPDDEDLVVFALYDLPTPDDAGALLDMLETLSRAKDARMREGLIRILSSDYARPEVPGVDRAFTVRKEVEAAGFRLPVASALGTVGPWCLEVLYSGVEGAEPQGDLERLAAWLRAQPAP